ncbi:hypothetical protein EYF80_003345 [Liparis tanakae]|uniref:Uncharacterized protein n=1 Tax=Liparis tanakae TaxID=230148 RepID=A0A4Z2J883_9TELE|nr:hypothetical protein EYF80_003345 [Liparis tanakae]
MKKRCVIFQETLRYKQCWTLSYSTLNALSGQNKRLRGQLEEERSMRRQAERLLPPPPTFQPSSIVPLPLSPSARPSPLSTSLFSSARLPPPPLSLDQATGDTDVILTQIKLSGAGLERPGEGQAIRQHRRRSVTEAETAGNSALYSDLRMRRRLRTLRGGASVRLVCNSLLSAWTAARCGEESVLHMLNSSTQTCGGLAEGHPLIISEGLHGPSLTSQQHLMQQVVYLGQTTELNELKLFDHLPGKVDDARDHDKHRHPQHSTGNQCMNPLEGGHLLSFVVERHQACDEDDHIEDERHVHVDVNHAADRFAPPVAQAPVMSGVVVNPEGHSEKEDEVGEDEVEYSNGGDGCRAELHDVHHQANADGPDEQNHGPYQSHQVGDDQDNEEQTGKV